MTTACLFTVLVVMGSAIVPGLMAPSAGAAQQFKGTLLVGTACQISGPVVEPECLQAQQAYYDQLNASGGVNGYKIVVQSCDTQTSPTVAANCVKSLTGNPNVLALVGSGGAFTITEHPDIADIGPAVDVPEEASAATSFPLSGFSFGGAGDYVPIAVYTKKKGSNKPGIIAAATSGGVSSSKVVQQMYSGKGVTTVNLSAPLTAVDLTPQVTSLQHSDVNVVYIIQGAAGINGALKAGATAGYSPYWGLVWSCNDQTVLSALPTTTNRLLCPSPFNVSKQALKPMVTAMNKYIGSGKWKMSAWGVNSWLAAQLVATDLKGITGTVTRQKVLTGMKKVTSFTSPLLAKPINFAKPGPSAYPAVRNWYWYLYSVTNRKLVSLGAPYNTLSS